MLSGGTAVDVPYGSRVSIDLDFFTDQPLSQVDDSSGTAEVQSRFPCRPRHEEISCRSSKHVLSALGTDDEDLIIISWNGLSGSISISYHPRFNNDRAFYDGKLKVLTDYVQTHDAE